MHLVIHHIRFCVKDSVEFSLLLRDKLGFSLYGNRKSNNANCTSGIVLRHNNITFVIDERNHSANGPSDHLCSGNLSQNVDTVCDICFACTNIPSFFVEHPQLTKELVVAPVTENHLTDGIVSYAVIKSPIGNLQHTLIDLSKFKGAFLPGFETYDHQSMNNYFESIDHIAYALNTGRSQNVLKWYRELLGFTRLFINQDDDEEDGFVVKVGSKGMRLKAAHASVVDHCNTTQDLLYSTPKFVVCESLNASAQSDQIGLFLSKHLSEGVQHIAFKTNDIIKSVSHLQSHGLNCISPPNSYYLNKSKSAEIQALKFDKNLLQSHNVLVESHLRSCASKSDEWFILQCFTRPVFPEDTLFFEVIQRYQTNSGFGAGNITALWKAVQHDMFKKKC
uniref:4-hydroxyphenylpyruvate dioxygenase n=1 Tax=Phallusia mammillata TaxID=59560 RepID=A0A6F9DF67_9ASCI|nr:4-hydroxyphenylpyruvate dioxygenase-like protein [Phallusia mammillata]